MPILTLHTFRLGSASVPGLPAKRIDRREWIPGQGCLPAPVPSVDVSRPVRGGCETCAVRMPLTFVYQCSVRRGVPQSAPATYVWRAAHQSCPPTARLSIRALKPNASSTGVLHASPAAYGTLQ